MGRREEKKSDGNLWHKAPIMQFVKCLRTNYYSIVENSYAKWERECNWKGNFNNFPGKWRQKIVLCFQFHIFITDQQKLIRFNINASAIFDYYQLLQSLGIEFSPEAHNQCSILFIIILLSNFRSLCSLQRDISNLKEKKIKSCCTKTHQPADCRLPTADRWH